MPDLHDWGTGKAPKSPHPFPKDYRPKWHVGPRTLDDLLQRAGPYADATKAYVEWGAVQAWLMRVWPNPALTAASISGATASLSVLLTSKAIEHETGWPQLSDRSGKPALYDLSADAQCETRRIAAEVYALWESAGRPYLDPPRIKDAYRWLVACVRSGSIPPVLTIGEVTAIPARSPAKPHILDMHKENT